MTSSASERYVVRSTRCRFNDQPADTTRVESRNVRLISSLNSLNATRHILPGRKICDLVSAIGPRESFAATQLHNLFVNARERGELISGHAALLTF